MVAIGFPTIPELATNEPRAGVHDSCLLNPRLMIPELATNEPATLRGPYFTTPIINTCEHSMNSHRTQVECARNCMPKLLLISRFTICERPCSRALALPRSHHLAARRRSRRDFKNHAFPMAEERWSVAVAGIYSTPFHATCKPENQIMVTRERTS